MNQSRKGITYTAHYTYQVGARVYPDDSDSIDKDFYNRITLGDGVEAHRTSGRGTPVTVRHFGIGWAHRSSLAGFGGFWLLLGFMTIWAGFWNTLMSIFVYQLWVVPLYARWLYKHGLATQGTLVQKRSTSGRSSACYVTCAFSVPGEGMPIQREIKVPSTDAWKPALAKQAVTILYSPKNPNRFVVYELSGYTVRD